MEKSHEYCAQPEKSKGVIDGFLLKKIGSLTYDLPPQFSGQKNRESIQGEASPDSVRIRFYNFSGSIVKRVTLMEIHRSAEDPRNVRDVSADVFNRYELGVPSDEAEPLVLYNHSGDKSKGLGLIGVALAIGRATNNVHATERAENIPLPSTLDGGVPKTV